MSHIDLSRWAGDSKLLTETVYIFRFGHFSGVRVFPLGDVAPVWHDPIFHYPYDDGIGWELHALVEGPILDIRDESDRFDVVKVSVDNIVIETLASFPFGDGLRGETHPCDANAAAHEWLRAHIGFVPTHITVVDSSQDYEAE